MEKQRPSPSKSATLFDEGTKKKGNDGKMWVVTLTSFGTKRWKKDDGKIVSSSTKTTKGESNIDEQIKKILSVKKRIINTFVLDFIRTVKHIGKMNFNKVLIGDILWNPLNLRSGNYDVYLVDNSPMIVHESVGKINRKKLQEHKFNDYNYGVGVDRGIFGFWDSKFIGELGLKKNVLPEINWKRNGLIKKNQFFLTPNDIVGASPSNEKIAFMSSTGVGDGFFACMVSGREMAILCGYDLSNKLHDRGLLY